MKQSSNNWLQIATKDLRLAKAALDIGEPIGVIFHLHDCLEKTLKSIAEESNIAPPRIHSLKQLAVDTCKIKLEVYQHDLLSTLDKAWR